MTPMVVTPTAPTMLTMRGITRRFGSVLALDDASLTVRPGTVHAVLGENGAGKTTLMRVAFGLLTPERGEITVRNTPTRIPSPADALKLGIGMVHQHFSLVPAMTVAENVALGGHGRFDPLRAADVVRTVSSRTGLGLDPSALVSSLTVGAQQRCEIVKALARDVSLLILDEPTAVLAPPEATALLRWMRAFADAGHAVVLITHKLRDALAVADDVTVLRRGRTVLQAAASTLTADALRIAMVGDDASTTLVEGASARPTTSTPQGSAVLSVHQLRVVNAQGTMRVRDASLEVMGGELVGIAAVEGSGQHELLRVLAGRLAPTSGRVVLPDRVGFVPEDRHRDALMLDASLTENVGLRDAGARRGRMPWGALRQRTTAIIAERDVRADGALAVANSLSGGNQQKLVIGRELADAPRAIVAENPSRGLDFHATAAVHAALRHARDAGAAVVMYSSDLDEVLALSDRVFVMFGGLLLATAHDRDAVGRAMLGSV